MLWGDRCEGSKINNIMESCKEASAEGQQISFNSYYVIDNGLPQYLDLDTDSLWTRGPSCELEHPTFFCGSCQCTAFEGSRADGFDTECHHVWRLNRVAIGGTDDTVELNSVDQHAIDSRSGSVAKHSNARELLIVVGHVMSPNDSDFPMQEPWRLVPNFFVDACSQILDCRGGLYNFEVACELSSQLESLSNDRGSRHASPEGGQCACVNETGLVCAEIDKNYKV